jgi:hypothetical protein
LTLSNTSSFLTWYVFLAELFVVHINSLLHSASQRIAWRCRDYKCKYLMQTSSSPEHRMRPFQSSLLQAQYLHTEQSLHTPGSSSSEHKDPPTLLRIATSLDCIRPRCFRTAYLASWREVTMTKRSVPRICFSKECGFDSRWCHLNFLLT